MDKLVTPLVRKPELILPVRGWVSGRLYDGPRLVRAFAGANLVVFRGREIMASLIGGGALGAPSKMKMGTSGAATTDLMTALIGTVLDTQNLTATSVLSRTITYSCVLGAGLAVQSTVKEFGIFNAADEMFARFISAEFQMFPGNTLAVDWSITIGD